MRTSACLLSLALTLSATAQVRDDVTVEVIEVPVYVSTASGHAVRGLTKDNFELRVNGHAQPIEYFEAIDFAARAKQESARPARERRLYLLLFDANYTVPAKLVRAQRAAEYALERSNPETDVFAVATHSSLRGVQFATPFVSDRAAIRRALRTLSVPEAHDPLSLAMSDAERATSTLTETTRDVADAEMADAIRGGAVFQDLLTDQFRARVVSTLRDFADLAGRLSSLQGQKHVLYFSTGFPSALIHGGSSAVPKGPGSGGGFDAGAMRDFQNFCKAFTKAGVFIDAVDIDGIRHQQGRIEAFNSDDSLQMVSHGTGGTYVRNRNDFGPALNDMLESQNVVYVLAFNRRENREGTVSVHVNGVPRGSRTSYRLGFGKPVAVKDVDPLQLADILLHDVPQTALPLVLTVSGARLQMEMRREEVLPQVTRDSRIETLLYVFDQNGTAVYGSGEAVDPNGGTGPITIAQTVKLPPGRYVAKAIARITGTASLGFARAEFTVQ